MANGLPYYSAYPVDFIGGCIGMSLEVKGAYRIVLDLIYMCGGELMDDPRYISGQLGCSVRKWKSIKNTLENWHEKHGGSPKIICENGIISNFRARLELEKTRKYQRTQSENRSKANKNKGVEKPSSDHTDTDTDTKKEDTPLIAPPKINQQPDAPDGGPDDESSKDGSNPVVEGMDRAGRKDAKSKRGTRLPADWRPDASCRAFADGLGLDPSVVADEFRDYWIAVAGAKGTKLDWPATFRNWCRRSRPKPGGFDPSGPKRPTGPKHGPASWTEASRKVLDRLNRANGRTDDGSGTSEAAGADYSQSGVRRGHDNHNSGLRGEVIALPGRYRD